MRSETYNLWCTGTEVSHTIQVVTDRILISVAMTAAAMGAAGGTAALRLDLSFKSGVTSDAPVSTIAVPEIIARMRVTAGTDGTRGIPGHDTVTIPLGILIAKGTELFVHLVVGLGLGSGDVTLRWIDV